MLEQEYYTALTSRLAVDGWQCDWDERFDFPIPVYTMGVDDDVVGQFSVDLIDESTGLAVYPTLGVRHLETSRLVTRFQGISLEMVGPAEPCSVGIALAALAGSGAEESWYVESVGDIDQKVLVLGGDLDYYGMPFLQRINSLEALADYLERDKRRFQQMNAHLAVASALLGRTERASNALSLFADEAANQLGPMLRQSRNFLESFVRYFGFGAESLASLSDRDA